MNADLHMAGDRICVKVNGVDVFHPNTGDVRSDDPEGIACWFVDTDYDEEGFSSVTLTSWARTTRTRR